MENGNEKERSYLMLKPECLQRGLCGKVIEKFEKKGYKLIALKMVTPTREFFQSQYGHNKDKDYYETRLDNLMKAPVIGMIWEGKGVVEMCRKLLGKTYPIESLVSTVRGGFCLIPSKNLLHASSSIRSAEKE